MKKKHTHTNTVLFTRDAFIVVSRESTYHLRTTEKLFIPQQKLQENGPKHVSHFFVILRSLHHYDN